METYYRILDVPVSANFRQIKKAFRKAAAKYHPDTNGGGGNPRMFSSVVEAYRRLENVEDKRKRSGSFKSKRYRNGVSASRPAPRRRKRTTARQATSPSPISLPRWRSGRILLRLYPWSLMNSLAVNTRKPLNSLSQFKTGY